MNTSSLLVEGFNGNDWKVIDNCKTSDNGVAKPTIRVPTPFGPEFIQFRFTYTKKTEHWFLMISIKV
jgi:hypothetical protein